MKRWYASLLGFMLSMAALWGQGGQVDTFRGPFSAEALSFYLDHTGGPLKIDFSAIRSQLKPSSSGGVAVPASVLLTVYDAAGNKVKTAYRKFPEGAKKEQFKFEFPSAAAGIWQVRAVGSRGNGISFDFVTVPKVKYGVMADRCMFGTAFAGQLSPSYLYIPAGEKQIKAYTRGMSVKIIGQDGRTVLTADKTTAKGDVKPGEICQVLFNGRGLAGIAGVPTILCPDAATAAKIQAGYVAAADGRKFPFAFQARMWDWMRGLKPADFAVKPVKNSDRKEAWAADPAASVLLGPNGVFAHAPHILASLPSDPVKTPPEDHYLVHLALYYNLDRPFNPYFGNKALLNRLLVGSFEKLITLKSNGTYDDSWSDYSGGDALNSLEAYLSFAIAASRTPEPLRGLWSEGLAMTIDRFCFSRVSCENQSSHWMVDLQAYYLGSGNVIYRDLARDYCAAMADPKLNRFMQTGYTQERYGPDGTYQGLCTCNIALYRRLSGDDTAKAMLASIYTFFNHTVAPEPDGVRIGSSGYGHRTNGSWVQKQWTGGMPLMAGELAEAGLWYSPEFLAERNPDWPTGGADDPWYKRNRNWTRVGWSAAPWSEMWKYLYPSAAPLKGVLPVAGASSFDRDFNGELYCARRPGYYAVAYAGVTGGGYDRPVEPLRPGWKMEKNILKPTTADAKKLCWHSVQGLQQFWTPGYGTAIVSMNWSLYTLQTVRADLPGGKVAWPELRSMVKTWDAAANKLSFKWKLGGTSIQVGRQLTFTAGGVKMQVTAPSGCWEQLPYMIKPGMTLEFGNRGQWSSAPPKKVDAVRMSKDGQGVEIRLARPTEVRLGPESHHYVKLGLLSFAVDGTLEYELQAWKKGENK